MHLQEHAAGMPSSPQQPVKLLYTKKEAAQMLSISVRKLDYLIADGEIKVRRIGKRVTIHIRALQQFASRDHVRRVQ